MKTVILLLTLITVQANEFEQRPVVHLSSNLTRIGLELGGKFVELDNSPPQIYLPAPPKKDSLGGPWAVDIKNLGPRPVKISGGNRFIVEIQVGQTEHIYSNGTTYSIKR